MVRKHKRKRTNYGNWPEESMLAAMRSVREGNTIRQAAFDHRVPRTSLQRRLVLARSENSEEQRMLTAKQEADITEFLNSYPSELSPVDIRRLVFEYVERNNIKHPFIKETGLAGKEWFFSFMKRNKDLFIRTNESIKPKTTRLNGHIEVPRKPEQEEIRNVPELVIRDIPKDISFRSSLVEESSEERENEEKMTAITHRTINSFHVETKNLYNNTSISSLKRKVVDKWGLQLPKKQKMSKTLLNRSYKIEGDIATAIRLILKEPSFQEKLHHHTKNMVLEVDALLDKGQELDGIFSKIETSVKDMKSELEASFPKDVDIVDENPSFANYLLSKNRSSDQQSATYMSTKLNHSGNASILLLQAREKFAIQLMRSDSSSYVLPKDNVNGVKNGLTTPRLTIEKDVNDVDILVEKPIAKPLLPGIGPVTAKELTVGMKVFAMKGNYLSVWQKAKIVNIKITSAGNKYCKVKYETGRTNAQRVYLAKHIAYAEPPDVILPVGSRVVAHFRDEVWSTRSSLYAGIIAEPPKLMNSYRYLIFFDDGYAQYVKHNEVYLVCDSSKDVWEDIYPDAKEFIKNYLQEYPERPMVKLQQGQVIKTEWNGSWWTAKVVEVDASLVKMFFHADRRTEWIYRGSTRLAPLYEELAAAKANRLAGKNKRHNVVTKKKHQPYVEYTRNIEEPVEQPVAAPATALTVEPLVITTTQSIQVQRPQVARKHTGGIPTAETISTNTVQRNVAKKSTTQILQENTVRATTVLFRPTVERTAVTVKVYQQIIKISTPFADSQYGQRENYKIKYYNISKYIPHGCSYHCLNKEDLESLRGSNPLSKPMATGWQRQIVKHRASNKRVTFYRSPCGRRLRGMSEVHRYLQETKSKLTVDLFCFDSILSPVAEFNPGKVNCKIGDITYGKEKLHVSCVNNIDYEYPPMNEYSSTRFPAKGVKLNLNPEFLCGCDCEDDCSDRDRCQCQQLTVSATSALPTGKIPKAGYKYRRLLEPLITGVYECNSRCKCSSTCFNRVVQNGLSARLQVFKTERRGWGIRSLNDIPQGMFICIYAGQLLTEQGANEDGNQYGDEYLAELDHIEVIERFKEGYESDVIDPDDNKESAEAKSGSDIESEDDSSYKAEKIESQSSDSDFDVSMKSPIEPMSHITRSNSKLKDSEMETDSSCSTAGKFTVPSSPSQPYENVEHWMKSISLSKQTPEGRRYFGGMWTSSKKISKIKGDTDEDNVELPDLDTEISDTSKIDVPNPTLLEDVNKIKLIRRPRVTKRISRNESSDQENDSQSNSEEDSIRTDAVSFTSETESEDVVRCKKSSLKSLGSIPDMKMAIMSTPRPNWSSTNKPKFTSLRSYFNEEYCYIMDAKNCGNIGRYLNHSCSPNVFVQNVFVDTHDLRFPWVAFFAMTYIRAGTELTWDYNYDVGSVPGKVMYCYCGSSECRGRLL